MSELKKQLEEIQNMARLKALLQACSMTLEEIQAEIARLEKLLGVK